MLLNRVTLFTFFGFKVKADASWIFLSLLISWSLAVNVFPDKYPGLANNTYHLMAVAAMAGIIVSVILHEVAHALIAEYYDMKIESITLFIFGGVAEMRGEPSHPRGEFFMAIAGPIMSGFLGILFLSTADMWAKHIDPGPVSYVFKSLAYLNFAIAAFNLVPAFPLDGGRALRAVIWDSKNNLVLATRLSSETGQIFGTGLLAYAVYKLYTQSDLLSAVWLALLGMFVSSAASYSLRQTESRSLLSQEKIGRFAKNQIATVSPDLTITQLVDDHVCRHYQRFFPVVDRGLLVGIVSLQAVLSLDRHKWQWLHVASVMDALTSKNTVTPEMGAAEALDMMQRHGQEILLVARDRKLEGVVLLQDLSSYLSITMRVDQNKSVTTGKTAY